MTKLFALQNKFLVPTEAKYLPDKHIVNLQMPLYKSNLTNVKYPEIQEHNSLESIVSSICTGLQCLHDNGCIYGNLKPSNVYYTNDEMTKCCLSDYMKNEITPKDTIPINSYYYMSPEMIKEEEYDSSTDIWSFGCLLYYIVTSTHIFPGHTIEDIKNLVAVGLFQPITDVPLIGDLLNKTIVKEKEKRIKVNEILVSIGALQLKLSNIMEAEHSLLVENDSKDKSTTGEGKTGEKSSSLDIIKGIVGNDIIDKEQKSFICEELLENKIILIYCGSSWSEPDKIFFPKLSKLYNEMKEDQIQFEIIYNSWDKTEDEYNEYIKEMPWYSIPFKDENIRKTINSKYRVTAIPTIIVLDNNGNCLNNNAYEMIEEDLESHLLYPWTKQTIYDLLNGDLYKGGDINNIVKSNDIINNKIFALLFSTSWCPVCRGFVPQVIDIDKQLSADGVDFPIIWVSTDSDKNEYNEYFNHLGLYAIPFEDKRIMPLYNILNITGIPSVVIYNKDGNKIRSDGRDALEHHPNEYPWIPNPILKVEDNPKEINEEPCVFCISGGDSKINEEFTKIGNELKRDNISFVLANTDDNKVCRQIRGLCHIERTPALFVIDILQDGAYYEYEGVLEYEEMKKFVMQYFACAIPRKQMG